MRFNVPEKSNKQKAEKNKQKQEKWIEGKRKEKGGIPTRIDIVSRTGVSKARSLSGRGFGSERGGKVVLHPVEVAYLSLCGASVYMGKRKLEVEEVLSWCFSDRKNVLLFFVYRDLRDRGRKVRISGDRLICRDIFIPVSERDELVFSELPDKCIVAVVDEEGDVTYYRFGRWDERGNQMEELETFTGIFAGDRVLTSNRAVFEKYFYGSLARNVVTLSLVEAAYLCEMGVLKLDVPVDELLREARKAGENFEVRYAIYRDLKERKFVVKTGFKFGSDFRVYEEVRKAGDLPHSKFLVKAGEKMRASEMASHVRVASAVRKKMVFGFLKGENVEYVFFERVKV